MPLTKIQLCPQSIQTLETIAARTGQTVEEILEGLIADHNQRVVQTARATPTAMPSAAAMGDSYYDPDAVLWDRSDQSTRETL